MHCTDQQNVSKRTVRNRLAWAGAVVGASAALWLSGCGQTGPMAPAGGSGGTASTAPKPAASVEPRVRSWAEYQQRAAKRIVAVNPDLSHLGEVEQPAMAIPVIEVELKSDGSIQKINVMRYPSQNKETTQVAIDAIKRAAPFGDVSYLPKPWKFNEVFLFNWNGRFKPRTLDQ